MAYGMTIGALSIAGAGGIGIVAAIGAMALALLWTARAMFMKRE